jgi:hypothetical protein
MAKYPQTKKVWIVVAESFDEVGSQADPQPGYVVDAIANYYAEIGGGIEIVLPRSDMVLEAIASNQNFRVQKNVTLFCTLDITESGRCKVLDKDAIAGCIIPPIIPGTCNSVNLLAYQVESKQEVTIIPPDGPSPMGSQIKILGGVPSQVKVEISQQLKGRKIRVIYLPVFTDSMMTLSAGECPPIQINRIVEKAENKFIHESGWAKVTNEKGIILLNQKGCVVKAQRTSPVTIKPINVKPRPE